MVVSLLKVLHSGLQDERLESVNPRLDAYVKIFRRAGRFSTQWVRIDFNQIPQFGQTTTLTIPRKGHLVSRIYLVTTMPDIRTPQVLAQNAVKTLIKKGIAKSPVNPTMPEPFYAPTFRWTNSLGHALIQEASISIGGTVFDRLNARLLEVLDEFNTPLEKVALVDSLIKREATFNTTALPPLINEVVTPLPFWFSRGDPSLWLPVDAISAADVRLDITFAPWQNLYYTDARKDDALASNTYKSPCETQMFAMENSQFFTINNKQNSTEFVKNLSQFQYSTGGFQPLLIPDVKMPSTFSLGDTYLMVEYVYLDKPEANRFRVSHIETPIPQHYALEPYDTQQMKKAQIPLDFPNPVRDIFFFCQRQETAAFNCPFLATRDISGLRGYAPWWPDADIEKLYPAFSESDSEPIDSIKLVYEGQRVRFSSENPALFRAIIPAFEQKKAAFYNRYFYNISFGFQHGLVAPSQPTGEANFSIIQKKELYLEMRSYTGYRGPLYVNRFNIYVFGESYNILTIYGGRAGLLFGY